MSAVPECIESVDPRSQGAQSRPAGQTVVSLLARIWAYVALRHEKRKSRRVLRDLTDAELQDIGLTRKQARDEASRSFFWD